MKHNKFQLNDRNLIQFHREQKIGEEDVIDDNLAPSIISVETINYQKHKKWNQYNHRYSTKKNTHSKDAKKNQWRLLPINYNNKPAQIEKYGVEVWTYGHEKRISYIRYGLKILELDYEGNYIALHEGTIKDFMEWFRIYIGKNHRYHLNVISRIDLLGIPMVCGVDFRINKEFGYKIISSLCKYGWLDGLKYVIEKLQINHINNNFDLLYDSVYFLHDDILKYLLIQNNFYDLFDITTKTHQYNKTNKTLLITAKNNLCDITKPGSGWLHLLESIHYAPYIIKAIHKNNNDIDSEKKEEEKYNEEGHQSENIILNEIKFEKVTLSLNIIEERIKIIDILIENKNSIFFKIESCHYGLCTDSAGGTNLRTIHFWKPHAVKGEYDDGLFEYIPLQNSHWGLLRMSGLSKHHYLTVLKDKKKVEFCRFVHNNIDDIQLWKIEKINILNGIWIRIINKSGYKLMFSWTNNYQCAYMPLLTISNDTENIDKLCRDIFSVSKHNRHTLYYQYYEKYKHENIKKNPILNRQIGTTLTKFQFWNIQNGELSKFDIYMNKLKNITEIIEQYKGRYINNKQNNIEKRRRSSPPPPPPYFNYINNAINTQRVIWISYNGHKKPFIPRAIIPIRWDLTPNSEESFFAIQHKSKSQNQMKFYLKNVIEIRDRQWAST